jgi:1,4-dihydroxy-2-naphthoate octaprenyltransferase
MTFRQLLGIVELRTKLVSASTFAAATAFSFRATGSLDLLGLALALPAVLFVDMGTTAFNSFFDYWRGEDRGGRLREPDKVLVTEGVPALAAFFVALGCFFLAACLGLAIAFHSGAWVLWAGGLCLLVGFSYNCGPLRLSRTPLGELMAGSFLGAALFLIVYRILEGSWGVGPFLASLPGSLLIASILSVNNACDMAGDAEAGRRTLALVLGPRGASVLPFALGFLAYALDLFLVGRGILPRAEFFCAAASLLASVPLYAAMARRSFSHETKGPSMKSVLACLGLFSLGYVVGLLI